MPPIDGVTEHRSLPPHFVHLAIFSEAGAGDGWLAGVGGVVGKQLRLPVEDTDEEARVGFNLVLKVRPFQVEGVCVSV